MLCRPKLVNTYVGGVGDRWHASQSAQDKLQCLLRLIIIAQPPVAAVVTINLVHLCVL